MVEQPAIAMAVKLSPLKGKFKPYVGLSGSLVARRWDVVTKDGTDLGDLIDPLLENFKKRYSAKKNGTCLLMLVWPQERIFALGEHLGLNLDLRYYINLHTENRKTIYQVLNLYRSFR